MAGCPPFKERMKIFFDTEFDDRGSEIVLLSIGAVREDGQEFYAENGDADLTKCNDWVLANVVPQFSGPCYSYASIQEKFKAFCGYDAELWAYYAGYDWWLAAQLYGGFMKMPLRSTFVNDIASLGTYLKRYNPPVQATGEHHALHDARWNKLVYEYVVGND